MSSESIKQTLGINTPSSSPIKKYMVLFLIFFALLAGGWFWINHTKKETIHYITAPVERKDLTTAVSATGNLEPTNTIDVGIEVSGTISDVLVDYNDRVKVGQIMARIDTTRLSSNVTSAEAALKRSQANVSVAKASLANAQNEWDRVHKMYTSTGGNYPSKQAVDEADNALLSAKASVAAAMAQTQQSQAELAIGKDNLRKAVVVSPIDGIVLNRKVEPGQTVVAAMQTPVLFTMAKNLNTMKVIVSVDEADIGEVKEHQNVSFSVDAYPNQTFKGVITQLRLNSKILNGVVTYDAVVEVPNDDLRLRPGMTATAQIITGTLHDRLTVPNAALRFTPPKDKNTSSQKTKEGINTDGKSIWVLRQNKPIKIDVSAGKSDGISTAIVANELKSNDSVIIGIDEK
jgi:HlyD family secretion protein